MLVKKRKLDNNIKTLSFTLDLCQKKKNPHLNLTYNFDFHASILRGHHLSSALVFMITKCVQASLATLSNFFLARSQTGHICCIKEIPQCHSSHVDTHILSIQSPLHCPHMSSGITVSE